MNREATEELLDEFHTPVHVRAHCLQVARIGEFLAKKLRDEGVDVDVELVWIAGMIHDFVRIVDFKKVPDDLGDREDREVWNELRKTYDGWHHADAAAKILEEIGENTLAGIIRQHKYSSMLTDDAPKSWESKILYYADKRIAHDQIVSLKERLEEGKKRHAPDTPLSEEEKRRHVAIYALENEIFSKITVNPDDLKRELGGI